MNMNTAVYLSQQYKNPYANLTKWDRQVEHDTAQV